MGGLEAGHRMMKREQVLGLRHAPDGKQSTHVRERLPYDETGERRTTETERGPSEQRAQVVHVEDPISRGPISQGVGRGGDCQR